MKVGFAEAELVEPKADAVEGCVGEPIADVQGSFDTGERHVRTKRSLLERNSELGGRLGKSACELGDAPFGIGELGDHDAGALRRGKRAELFKTRAERRVGSARFESAREIRNRIASDRPEKTQGHVKRFVRQKTRRDARLLGTPSERVLRAAKRVDCFVRYG